MGRKQVPGNPPAATLPAEDSYAKVKSYLAAGRPERALEEIAGSGERSGRMTNATAVCQMRLGRGDKAVELLRGLAMRGALQFRDDVPGLYKVNFAVALLSAGNMEGFVTALHSIRDGEPYIGKYRDAYERWRSERSFSERIAGLILGKSTRPFLPDFPLGEVE